MQQLPWLKILLPFIIGILLASTVKIPFSFFGIAFCCYLMFIVLHVWYKRYNKTIVYITTITTILVCGIAYTQLFLYHFQQKHFSNLNGTYAIGYISKGIEEKEKSYKTIITIIGVVDSLKQYHNAKGNILCYLSKDTSAQQFCIGDKLIFQLNYRSIDAPKNPNQFNYKKYLSNKQIYHQCYLKPYQYQLLQHKERYAIKRVSATLSKKAQNILKTYITHPTYFALADGILLGHTNAIDADLYLDFAHTGILHILSVSGLHVGIIYLLISWLLKFIPNRNRKIIFIKFVFAALLIWIFAFVVGLSPAVVRAALLFTLLHFGRIIQEDVHPINILLGACFVQLSINPLLIYDIGFQLSYLAMLGLFIFYKPIYSRFYFKFKLVDYIWQLWSASIAAQLFTFPLSIYYFGNFPTYFLLANIFAIPLSSVILWLSVLLLPVSVMPKLAIMVGNLCSWCIALFVKLTTFFASLPYAKINSLYLTLFQVVGCYLALILLSIGLFQKKIRCLYVGISLLIITVFTSYFNTYNHWKNDKIIFYSIKDNLVIGHQHQEQLSLYYKNPIGNKDFGYTIQNSIRQFQCNKVDSILIEKKIYTINNTTIYILDASNNRLIFNTPLNIDYLLLSNNLYLDIKYIQDNYRFKQLIICSDNDYRHTNIYRKLLNKAQVNYHDLNIHSWQVPN